MLIIFSLLILLFSLNVLQGYGNYTVYENTTNVKKGLNRIQEYRLLIIIYE